MTAEHAESDEERRARYKRLAITAAARAARTPTAEVRAAYLILAESWSSQADAWTPRDSTGAAPATPQGPKS